jgi:HlyD family secretion protein
MKAHILLIAPLALLFFSCSEEERITDAAGVFEATEIIVSAEATGKILDLNISEGDRLQANQQIGLIDSTQLHLKKMQLIASKKAIAAGRPDIKAQIDATEQEIARQEREKTRIEKLLAGDVATQKQLDDIEAAIDILKARLRSQKSSLNNSVNAVDAQINTINVQIAQLDDQIDKSIVYSPIKGTVLVKYAEPGEMTGMGKALFKIADVDHMILKASVNAYLLANVKIGQEVKELAEFGAPDNREYAGNITWISSKAEFTPKTIQTQDERANLVYALIIAVKNDDYLTIGRDGGFKLAE